MRSVLFAIMISMSVGLVPVCEVLAAENPALIKFDSKKWSQFQNREAIARELIQSHALIGLTSGELQKLLGHPYKVDAKEVFPLKSIRDGSHGEYKNILPSLEIHYSNSKIQNVSIGTHEFGNKLPEGAPIPDQN